MWKKQLQHRINYSIVLQQQLQHRITIEYRRQWCTQSSHIRSAKNSRFLCSGIIFIMLTETPSKAEYVTC